MSAMKEGFDYVSKASFTEGEDYRFVLYDDPSHQAELAACKVSILRSIDEPDKPREAYFEYQPYPDYRGMVDRIRGETGLSFYPSAIPLVGILTERGREKFEKAREEYPDAELLYLQHGYIMHYSTTRLFPYLAVYEMSSRQGLLD